MVVIGILLFITLGSNHYVDPHKKALLHNCQHEHPARELEEFSLTKILRVNKDSPYSLVHPGLVKWALLPDNPKSGSLVGHLT